MNCSQNFGIALSENILYAELPSNDTWARDHGPLTVFIDNKPVLYDFTFNGWGGKFEAGLDNQITGKLLFSWPVFPKGELYE